MTPFNSGQLKLYNGCALGVECTDGPGCGRQQGHRLRSPRTLGQAALPTTAATLSPTEGLTLFNLLAPQRTPRHCLNHEGTKEMTFGDV